MQDSLIVFLERNLMKGEEEIVMLAIQTEGVNKRWRNGQLVFFWQGFSLETDIWE